MNRRILRKAAKLAGILAQGCWADQSATVRRAWTVTERSGRAQREFDAVRDHWDRVRAEHGHRDTRIGRHVRRVRERVLDTP